nr:hypothetical protein [Tanacetum cinerariifolium]
MFDEYFTPPSISISLVQEAAAPRAVVLAESLVSTSIDQDAPLTSIPSTQEHFLNISQGFEESPKTPSFCDDPLHEDSTSLGSSSNVRKTYTLFEHLELKNFKQAMTEPSWIGAMQEEIHEFEGLQTYNWYQSQVIVARNKRNAELEQETELLKTTLRNKEATIASLTSETKTVLSEKKALEDNQSSDPPKPVTPFVHTRLVNSEVKFQKFKECANSNATPLNVIFEINKLKDQLQERDETIRNLESQFNISRMLKIGSPVGSLDKNAIETEITKLKDNITSLRIQNDGYKIEIANHTRRYLELSKASTHSRNTSNEKIAALNAEIAKMKPSGSGTKVSRPKTPEKPKVLAPGMYAISSKYITPLGRGDWAPPTPKKKHVMFQEPPRDSTTHVKQPAVNNHKQPNVNVIVSTGLTPAAEVSKPQFTRENQKSRVLPTKNESARRVEDHPRNFNKRNNVNSSLNDKRFGSVKNAVCDACNKCLVSFTHDKCYVHSVNTMHAKKPQVARLKTIPKNVRKTDITVAYRIVPQWKSTGRQFILCDIYGPKKSKAPTAKPLKLSPSVSSSSPINVISRFFDCQLRCSRHMTDDRLKLINYVEKFVGTVRFGNDQFATIIGYGDYKMGYTIISRVYYVEGLSHNLFSVGQFCDGASPVCLLTKASSIKSWLWHRRLNHLNFGTLNELAHNDLVRGLPLLKYDKDHLFPFCQLGKSKKASHPLKNENSNKEILSLLHMDLCGPMRMESINKKSVGPELTALQLGRTRSALVNDPPTSSVPPTMQQFQELFQPMMAPENANGSPSTTNISKGAPAVTPSSSASKSPSSDTDVP